jgi:hypothetical protein
MPETTITLANGWTLRSEAGDNVRLVQPDGTERIYWDRNEWHEDPVGVMAAIFGASVRLPADNEDFRGRPLPADNPEIDVRAAVDRLIDTWQSLTPAQAQRVPAALAREIGDVVHFRRKADTDTTT